MSASPPLPPDPPEKLVFHCPSCRLKLALEHHLAGVSGPCPGCGSQITAPTPPATAQQSRPSGKGFSRTKASSRASKGRIFADSAIDYRHLERKESIKTLLILGLFVSAIFACLAVYGFMKDWGSR